MEIDPTLISSFLKEVVQKAIEGGVPPSYFAYLLILPFLASLVAAGRHLLGLTTYGTFLPAIISVVWLEIGLELGLILFLALIGWAKLIKTVLKKGMTKGFKINYLPRMAIFILLISLGILVLGLFPSAVYFLKDKSLIFSLLVMALIVQNLIETQITLSKIEARTLIWETIAFALIGYGLMSWVWLQHFVLNHPALVIILTLVFNIYVGRYVGFRLLEYHRFKSIVKKP